MKILKRLFVFIITCLVLFIGLELYLRFSEIIGPEVYDAHPEFGRTYRKGINFNHFREGFTIDRINDYGYLGPGYPPQKPKDTIRIALLGDSYVQGFDVLDRHHFRNLLEKQLGESIDGVTFEVMNFGRDDFDIYEMYHFYEKLAKKFEPDIAIFFISTLDFRQRYHVAHPNFVYEDGTIVTDYSYQKSGTYTFFKKTIIFSQYSRIARLMRNGYNLIRIGRLPRILFDKFYFTKKKHVKLDESTLRVDLDENKLAGAVIDAIGEIDTVYFVNKGKAPLVQNIIDRSELNNITCLDVLPVFNAMDGPIAHNFWLVTNRTGHWNQYGHQAVADYLTKNLVPDIKEMVNNK